jgi:glycine/D-amino acid oxidase-like deaminating enzyme
MTMQQQVVIVGGGVIGLLTAFNLASEVQSVVLLDRSNVGQESSWAGGGIVSPLYPWRYSPAVTALAHWSQDFYPQLGERLFAATGVDPEVHTTGLSAGNDYYTITPTLTDQTFLLTAARKAGSMATDKCGDFTITNTGVRSMVGAKTGLTTKDCWGR